MNGVKELKWISIYAAWQEKKIPAEKCRAAGLRCQTLKDHPEDYTKGDVRVIWQEQGFGFWRNGNGQKWDTTRVKYPLHSAEDLPLNFHSFSSQISFLK